MRRLLVVGALSVAMMPALAGVASAHAVSVSTPGRSHVQPVHSGDPSLPPHTGAFNYHVTCAINGVNPVVVFLGPSDCP